jgi:hypothetical protein
MKTPKVIVNNVLKVVDGYEYDAKLDEFVSIQKYSSTQGESLTNDPLLFAAISSKLKKKKIQLASLAYDYTKGKITFQVRNKFFFK